MQREEPRHVEGNECLGVSVVGDSAVRGRFAEIESFDIFEVLVGCFGGAGCRYRLFQAKCRR